MIAHELPGERHRLLRDVDERLEAQQEVAVENARKMFKGTPSPADLVEIGRAGELENAKAMVRRAEDFYTSLGMPALPASFWQKSMFLRPRDRDALCHASAWPMDLGSTDMRIKMCIRPTEEDQYTIYHELGHIYYYLAYKDIEPIFQGLHRSDFGREHAPATRQQLFSVESHGCVRCSQRSVNIASLNDSAMPGSAGYFLVTKAFLPRHDSPQFGRRGSANMGPL